MYFTEHKEQCKYPQGTHKSVVFKVQLSINEGLLQLCEGTKKTHWQKKKSILKKPHQFSKNWNTWSISPFQLFHIFDAWLGVVCLWTKDICLQEAAFYYSGFKCLTMLDQNTGYQCFWKHLYPSFLISLTHCPFQPIYFSVSFDFSNHSWS